MSCSRDGKVMMPLCAVCLMLRLMLCLLQVLISCGDDKLVKVWRLGEVQAEEDESEVSPKQNKSCSDVRRIRCYFTQCMGSMPSSGWIMHGKAPISPR